MTRLKINAFLSLIALGHFFLAPLIFSNTGTVQIELLPEIRDLDSKDPFEWTVLKIHSEHRKKEARNFNYEMIHRRFQSRVWEAQNALLHITKKLLLPEDNQYDKIYLSLTDSGHPRSYSSVHDDNGKKVLSITIDIGYFQYINSDDDLAFLISRELESPNTEISQRADRSQSSSAKDQVLDLLESRSATMEADLKGTLRRLHHAKYNIKRTIPFAESLLAVSNLQGTNAVWTARRDALGIAISALERTQLQNVPDVETLNSTHCERFCSIGSREFWNHLSERKKQAFFAGVKKESLHGWERALSPEGITPHAHWAMGDSEILGENLDLFLRSPVHPNNYQRGEIREEILFLRDRAIREAHREFFNVNPHAKTNLAVQMLETVWINELSDDESSIRRLSQPIDYEETWAKLSAKKPSDLTWDFITYLNQNEAGTRAQIAQSLVKYFLDHTEMQNQKFYDQFTALDPTQDQDAIENLLKKYLPASKHMLVQLLEELYLTDKNAAIDAYARYLRMMEGFRTPNNRFFRFLAVGGVSENMARHRNFFYFNNDRQPNFLLPTGETALISQEAHEIMRERHPGLIESQLPFAHRYYHRKDKFKQNLLPHWEENGWISEAELRNATAESESHFARYWNEIHRNDLEKQGIANPEIWQEGTTAHRFVPDEFKPKAQEIVDSLQGGEKAEIHFDDAITILQPSEDGLETLTQIQHQLHFDEREFNVRLDPFAIEVQQNFPVRWRTLQSLRNLPTTPQTVFLELKILDNLNSDYVYSFEGPTLEAAKLHFNSFANNTFERLEIAATARRPAHNGLERAISIIEYLDEAARAHPEYPKFGLPFNNRVPDFIGRDLNSSQAEEWAPGLLEYFADNLDQARLFYGNVQGTMLDILKNERYKTFGSSELTRSTLAYAAIRNQFEVAGTATDDMFQHAWQQAIENGEASKFFDPNLVEAIDSPELRARFAKWQIETRFFADDVQAKNRQSYREANDFLARSDSVRPIASDVREHLAAQFKKPSFVGNAVIEHAERLLISTAEESKQMYDLRLNVDNWSQANEVLAADLPHLLTALPLGDPQKSWEALRFFSGMTSKMPDFLEHLNFNLFNGPWEMRREILNAHPYARAYAFLPLLTDSRNGILRTRETQEKVIAAILGERASDPLARKMLLHHLKAMDPTRREQNIALFFASQQDGEHARRATFSIGPILDSKGPFGIKAAQTIKTSGTLGPEHDADLEHVFDRALEPSRNALHFGDHFFYGLNEIFGERSPVVAVGEMAGSASINHVNDVWLAHPDRPNELVRAAVKVRRKTAVIEIQDENGIWARTSESMMADESDYLVHRNGIEIEELRLSIMQSLDPDGPELNHQIERGFEGKAREGYQHDRDPITGLRVDVAHVLGDFQDLIVNDHQQHATVYEFIDAHSIDDISDQSRRRNIYEQILQAELEAMLDRGIFDPDGHPGNWLYEPHHPDGARLVRIDYAQLAVMPNEEAKKSVEKVLKFLLTPTWDVSLVSELEAALPHLFDVPADMENDLKRAFHDVIADNFVNYGPHQSLRRFAGLRRQIESRLRRMGHFDFNLKYTSYARAAASSLNKLGEYRKKIGNLRFAEIVLGRFGLSRSSFFAEVIKHKIKEAPGRALNYCKRKTKQIF